MKRRGEEYQLFWRDDRPDFVRLAAKYDALIVPFAAVGADDAYNLFLVQCFEARMLGCGWIFERPCDTVTSCWRRRCWGRSRLSLTTKKQPRCLS